MEWIEIIIMRVAGKPERPLDHLREIISSLAEPDLMEIGLYRHYIIPGDIALALHWQKENLPTWGSVLAQQIIQEIWNFGLIDHSIWLLETKRPEKNEETDLLVWERQ